MNYILIGCKQLGTFLVSCEDTYDYDCSDYISYCNDPNYPWMSEVCPKTCGYCDNGKLYKLGHNINFVFLIIESHKSMQYNVVFDLKETKGRLVLFKRNSNVSSIG